MRLDPPTFQLPIQAADGAAAVDNLYYFVYWFSVVFQVAIVGAMLYFVVVYRRKKGVKAEPTKDLTKLELFWTITPLIFIVYLFHVGFDVYIKNATAAEGATEIRVRGKKWSWEFEYPTGSREFKVLYLAVNKPVKLVLSSEDVLHSFYIPAFRQKRDAVPGVYSHIVFTPTLVGEYQVFCAEYCGTDHSGMLAKIYVVSDDEYAKHLDKIDRMPEGMTPADWGKSLFEKSGCTTCHSRDGSKLVGPSLKGVAMTMQPIVGGPPVMADENYIRESILRPQAKIVEGYTQQQMPPFVFKEPQLDAIIAYLKTVK